MLPPEKSSPIMEKIKEYRESPNLKKRFKANQLMLSITPPSYFVENYLETNEGRPQSLAGFGMMRDIYDKPRKKVLLKCSRKTLKSTILSNMIALNMIRWNYFKMLYLGPLESTANYFSANYVVPRFRGSRIKKLLVEGFRKDDIKEKILADTESSILFKYAHDDASRIRGPATDLNMYDEVQDIDKEVLPIVAETMSLSDFQWEIYAGTPLSTGNTIESLWRSSNRMEWATKCGKCNHWNTLTEDNNPMKMIGEHGLLCSKCGHPLDTRNGLWVASHSDDSYDTTGFHLAQPIIPFYNQHPERWSKIYKKVTGGRYAEYQIYNEVFGISFDTGLKPITEDELRAVCVLGEMSGAAGKMDLKIFNERKSRYVTITAGVDWGINGKTPICIGGLREDGVYEVFFAHTFHDREYERHIDEMASLIKGVGALTATDAGPDPIRGISLAQKIDVRRVCLVRYDYGKTIQHTYLDPHDWRNNRWILHKRDSLGFVFSMIKAKKILFPRWEDVSQQMQDILNEDFEVRSSLLADQLFYTHKPDLPDDFLHALNYAACLAFSDSALQGPSSTAEAGNQTPVD
jgi:hypothetical protein